MSDQEHTWSDMKADWARYGQAEKAVRDSWAHPLMKQMWEMAHQIEQAGWRGACYCPKDGSEFLAWDPGTSAPYICRYEGKWPDGTWIAYCDGDAWPARPTHFRPITPEESEQFNQAIRSANINR